MECSICLLNMDAMEQRPKVLPCGHTFCLRCLLQKPDKTCAICRKVYHEAVNSLPDNYIVFDMPERQRWWCRDCNKASTDPVCLDDHHVSSLKRARTEHLQPELAQLQVGVASLGALRGVVESYAVGVQLQLCGSRLQIGEREFAEAQDRLKAAVDGDTMEAVKKAKLDALKPAETFSVLAESASQLVPILADPTTVCTVTVQQQQYGSSSSVGATWTGRVSLSNDALAKALLCHMLCAKELHQSQQADGHGAVELVRDSQWKEALNQAITPEAMAVMIKVGSRVVISRDQGSSARNLSVPEAAVAPGTVTSVGKNNWVTVKMDSGRATIYQMGSGFYTVALLTTFERSKVLLLDDQLVDLEEGSSSGYIGVLTSQALDEATVVLGLHCDLKAGAPLVVSEDRVGAWSQMVRQALERVAPNLEVLDMVNPSTQHLEVVRAMPRLTEVHVCLTATTAQQLESVLEVGALRRLEAYCRFTDAPLVGLVSVRRPAPPAGLRWLRCGLYPLCVTLAVLRAHSATLEELQLLASTEPQPYGCPDLAGELARCGLRSLKRLVLWRKGSDGAFLQHTASDCTDQKASVLAAFEFCESIQADFLKVACSLCDCDPLNGF